MLKTSIVLHIFYEDIASQLLDSLMELDADFDLFVTTPLKLNASLSERLENFGHAVQLIERPNLGQDVAPFLSIVPMLVDNRYEAVCKLHTKRGIKDLGEELRRLAIGAVVGSSARFTRIQGLFESEK